MDFFSAQQAARRASTLMVVLLGMAVAAVILAVHAVIAASLWWVEMGEDEPDPDQLIEIATDPEIFLSSVVTVGLLVIGATLWKVWNLAQGGGAAVAESVGGRLVERATGDAAERRLLNVVEEIAIASGIPVPPVYLMDGESEINAFAAGYAPHQAVVAVTRGALDRLTRDELQGVVAHEFSHVLNGDMRLNIEMMGAIHGIMVLDLIGRGMVRAGSRSRRGGGMVVVVGGVLVAIGWIGSLFGELIKAAISRQREYLADASAVQFTRNPSGIANALRKIGDLGSRMDHPRAAEISHMYFGAAISGLFATHPPLTDRILRLTGEKLAQTREPADPEAFFPGALGFAQARAAIDALPAALADALRDPAGARMAVFAMLAAEDGGITPLLTEAGMDKETVDTLLTAIRSVPADQWIAVVDLAIPALSEMDASTRAEFQNALEGLAERDEKISVFERAVIQLLRSALSRAKEAETRDMRTFAAAAARVIAALAHAGHDDDDAAGHAYRIAIAHIPAAVPLSPRGQSGLWPLSRALSVLAGVPPLRKKMIMDAAVLAVQSDGVLNAEERRLIAMIGQSLGIPVPPSLESADISRMAEL